MRISQQSGIKCIFCTSVTAEDNVAGPDSAARRRGVAHLKHCVDIVAEFGGNVLSGLPYAPWGFKTGMPRTRDEELWSQESVREVCQYAQQSNILIAIEPVNRFECYFLATAAEAIQYCSEVGEPNIGVHLDTFQMNIEEKDIAGAIRRTGNRLYHFHMCASDRGVPGEDHILWSDVFAALKDIGYDRWITVESFSPEPGGPGATAAIWRRLAPSSDAIAEGALKVFRKYLG